MEQITRIKNFGDITYPSELTPSSKPNTLGGGYKQRPRSLEIDYLLIKQHRGRDKIRTDNLRRSE